MKREVKVRGRDMVLYWLRQKKKLEREERDSGGHTVYIFELDDDDLKAVQEFAAQQKKRNYFGETAMQAAFFSLRGDWM